MKKKVFIRFGHEILSNGNCTAANGILSEYDVIRDYADYLVGYLASEASHFDVKVFNPARGQFSDKNTALNAGIKAANDWGADLFISCHVNASGVGGVGTEVLAQNNRDSRNTANAIRKAIVRTLRTTDRGEKIKESEFGELRNTNMPAVIIEPFFCDVQSDCSKYKAVGARNLAKAIADAVPRI